MATMILSKVGAALGSAFGPIGTVLGRAGGALLRSTIDNAVFGGAPDVEGPRLGPIRVATAEEGLPIPRAYGTVRCGGHLIWATRFEEEATTAERQGGSATGAGGSTTTYDYYGNAAYALCEGPIAHLRRVWADGRELDLTGIEMRVHRGTDDQLPDPLIEAKQGEAPAYRGTAYVVFERLALAPFGNRLPQLSFEIVRGVNSVARDLRAITIIPGASEHGYDPDEVTEELRPGESVSLNRHVRHAPSDWAASIDELQALCPNLEAVSLVVSWFGDDLDCARCRIQPRVETAARPGASKAWSVGGRTRASARTVSAHDGGPAFGGTPSDDAVTGAIRDLKARGLKVFLYPFVLMDVPPGNGLADPYGGAEQAAFPWRGRMSVSPAPGRDGSPDGTAGADAAMAAFLGNDLAPNYAAFIAHYASLCAAAGGVDGFVIGSEMRGLTWVRGASGHPFVDGLRAIAAATKATLPNAAITYAADWTEWYGYQPPGEPGTLLYHLDPLWADPAIDAVGIDCYVPLTDLREGDELDGGPDGIASALDVAGLVKQIEGGEGFDWFYASAEDRAARRRTPITDGAQGKPWVWRVKDVRSWWANEHVERLRGTETGGPTGWVPRSKPIWLTELGAPAVDKAANQPNVFPDPKSSEDAAPYHSTGARDDAAQHAVLRAHLDHWADNTGPIDPAHTFLWTWDARPAPAFPVRSDVWSDGANLARGHWLNGRLSGAPIAEIIGAVLRDHGFERFDVSAVSGFAAGLMLDDPASARASLTAILDAHSIGLSERGGVLHLRSTDRPSLPIPMIGTLAVEDGEPDATARRAREIDLPDEIALGHRDPLRDHEAVTALARSPGGASHRGATSTPLVMEREQALAAATDLLHRAREGRDTLELAVPWSDVGLRAGDTVHGPSLAPGRWLIERVEDGEMRRLSLRAAPASTTPPPAPAEVARPVVPIVATGSPRAVMLDLPVIPGREAEGGAAVAAWTRPWRKLAVLTRDADGRLRTRVSIEAPGTIGTLRGELAPGSVGPFDRANEIVLDCPAGAFASASERAVLGGANALAVRCAAGWEIVQFARAEETAPGRWRLSRLLRGRLGTEPAMRSGAATGADAVLLDGAVVPVALDPSEIGAPTLWRVGPPAALDPARFRDVNATLGERAVTPLSPVHLSSDGETLRWVRRSRIDADRWDGEEIALGEEHERYRVRLTAGNVARTLETADPVLTIPPDLPRPLIAAVAQFGAREGDVATITIR